MSDCTVTIDGIKCKAKEGDFILNIARANDIFIPALCYLTNCSPTLACRLCLVEIDGKRAYSCNAKAKEGMDVITKSEEIERERKAIMEVYDVNHPLECGVCDQSGECELQNYTMEMGVDKQNLATADTPRPARDWGKIHYDPSLCIVCERCVTVCKDMIGEAALKTVPRGGPALDKEWKEQMPKDAYTMWNKLQKSIIGIASGAESLDCTQCGECSAVCPVGALVSSDFQYTSNAWELKKIPAANPHSSDCSLLYYDVKHTSLKDRSNKIYRVSSDFSFAPLHGAARYGFDFENPVEGKDEEAFNKVVDAMQQKVDTIEFTSYITNEEALILQKLKEKFGYKLINKDALAYKKFIQAYSKTAGKSLYSADLGKIQASNFVVCMGTAVKTDAPNVGYAINNALTMNKGAGFYFHPIEDKIVKSYAKNFSQIKHDIGKEEAIVYLLLDLFGKDLPENIRKYLDTFHSKTTKKVTEKVTENVTELVKKTVVDEETKEEKEVEEEVSKPVSKEVEKEVEVEVNALFELAGAEDFSDSLEKLLAKKDSFALVAGEDLYSHPRAQNIAKLLGLLERFSDFDVLIVPSKTNTLGVSLICDLDEEKGKFSLGYNVKGDVNISALGSCDLPMPALNQQEGTFSSLNKRVVPTNVAISFDGYCLNDIANALGFDKEYTIDYTKELPSSAGFKAVEFDSLPNTFLADGTEDRGYALHVEALDASDEAEEIAKTQEFNKDVLYLANPVHQFSAFTNKAHQLNEAGALYASAEFIESRNFKDGDIVSLENEGGKLSVAIKLDDTIEGKSAYLPSFDTKLNSEQFFEEGYRFASVTIKGADNE